MLVGRDRERRALERLLDEARGGRSGVLALIGEPGIGKSALLDAAAEAAAGMRVLRARGVPSESHIPFAGLFELLRPALGSLDRIPPPQAEALETRARAAPRPGGGPVRGRRRHAEPARRAGRARAARGARRRRALARRLERGRAPLRGPPAGRRPDRRRPHRPGRRGVAARRRRPPGAAARRAWPPDAAALLLRRDDPAATDDTAARLHRETGGNPLALLELARERAAAGCRSTCPCPW